MPDLLKKAVPPAFAAYILLVLCLIVFVAPFMDYASKQPEDIFGAAYILIALVVGFCICLVVSWKNDESKRSAIVSFIDSHSFLCIAALGIALFCVQLLILSGCFFRTEDWDIGALVHIGNRSMPYAYDYFTQFTHQQFLGGLFVAIAKLSNLIGFPFSYYLLFTIGGCLSVSVSITLATFVAKRLFGTVWALFAFAFMGCFIGCQQCGFVPYTDAYGMLCPALVLFCAFCVKNPYLKWGGVALFGAIGYYVKPTSLFSLMSIMFIGLLYALPRLKAILGKSCRHGEKVALLRRYGAIGLSIIVCLIAGTTFARFIIGCNGVGEYDKDYAVGPPYFLLMGFNDSSGGVYNYEDVNFILSFDTKAERDIKALEHWTQRVEEMGPSRIINLFAKKSIMNYNSGTYNFFTEGSIQVVGKNELLQKWYGLPDPRNTLSPWDVLAQIAWMFVLLGIVFHLFTKVSNGAILFLSLTLVMQSVFLLLFECRARYLFLYSPYFVTLALFGWKAIVEKYRLHHQGIVD